MHDHEGGGRHAGDTPKVSPTAFWEEDDTRDVPPVREEEGHTRPLEEERGKGIHGPSESWEEWLRRPEGQTRSSEAGAAGSGPGGEDSVDWPYELTARPGTGGGRADRHHTGALGRRLGAVSGRSVLFAALLLAGAIALVWFVSTPSSPSPADLEAGKDVQSGTGTLLPHPREQIDPSGVEEGGEPSPAAIPDATHSVPQETVDGDGAAGGAIRAATSFLAGFGTPTLRDARAYEEFQIGIAVPERREEFLESARDTRSAIEAELGDRGVSEDAPFVYEAKPLRTSATDVGGDSATVEILALTVFGVSGVADLRTGLVDYVFALERRDGDWRAVSVDVSPLSPADPTVLGRLLAADAMSAEAGAGGE